MGNRAQVVDTNGTTTVGYDAGYQVTDATYPNDDEQSFTYDPMGNRLSMSLTGQSTATYSYDAADQMTAAGGVSYGYDDNGNQTSRGSDTFDYDPENRLTATDIDSVGSYGYNGDGLRANRTVDANSVDYVWDQASALPEMLQDSDGNTYVYGLDLISRTDGGDDTVYYLCDGLGSTTGLTDENGDPIAEYQYDVFGAVRDHTGAGSTEFTYTGEQNDPTGLEYLRARYYDPATGRFMSRDPLGSLQAYPYAANNPMMLIDPWGLCPSGAPKIGPVPTPPTPIQTPGPTGHPAQAIRSEMYCPPHGGGSVWPTLDALYDFYHDHSLWRFCHEWYEYVPGVLTGCFTHELFNPEYEIPRLYDWLVTRDDNCLAYTLAALTLSYVAPEIVIFNAPLILETLGTSCLP